ncbi:MAG: hypothetical protein OXE92_11015 [Bacteroidetes bacterium]|nr:hypothetical protein [Bacteroidota bacterium]MCY4206242.1 hypothetical protein [Bacteroidota bacterium]
MIVATHVGLLVLSVYLIVKSSDSLVDLASGIGRKAKLSDYFIGSFIVGIGTSLPELFTSVAAANSGSPELVSPNIFGTVIANLGLGFGLGVLALFFFVRAEDGRLRVFTRAHAFSNGYLNFGDTNASPVIFASLSVLLTLVLCLDNKFGRLDAVLFAVLYITFMGWQFYQSRSQQPAEIPHPTSKEISHTRSKQSLFAKALRVILPTGIALLFAGVLFIIPDARQELFEVATGGFALYCFMGGLLLLLIFQIWDYLPELRGTGGPESSNVANVPILMGILLLGLIIAVLYSSGVIVVGSLVKLSEDLGINSGALAASALAIGTSLPDIVVALNVTRRGRHKLLVGHIFQSNVFDALLIMAVCGFIIPLPDVASGPSMICIVASVILTLPMLWTLRSRKLTALGGMGLFIGFLVFQFLLYG